MIRIADVLSIACLILIAWAMLTPTLQAYTYGDRKLMLNLPLYILWVVALAGMAGTILCAFGALLLPAISKQGAVMSPPLIGLAGVVVLLALLLLRVPVWIALALVGFFGTMAVSGWGSAFALAGTVPFDTSSAYTLSVIPLVRPHGGGRVVDPVVGRSFQRRARDAVGVPWRSCGCHPGRLGVLRRGVGLFGRQCGHHDPDGAARAAQGRLRRRSRNRVYRGGRQHRHPHSAVDRSRDLCGDRGAVGAEIVCRRADPGDRPHRPLHPGGDRGRLCAPALRAVGRELPAARKGWPR